MATPERDEAMAQPDEMNPVWWAVVRALRLAKGEIDASEACDPRAVPTLERALATVSPHLLTPDATLDGLLAKRDEFWGEWGAMNPDMQASSVANLRAALSKSDAAIHAHVAQREAALREECAKYRAVAIEFARDLGEAEQGVIDAAAEVERLREELAREQRRAQHAESEAYRHKDDALALRAEVERLREALESLAVHGSLEVDRAYARRALASPPPACQGCADENLRVDAHTCVRRSPPPATAETTEARP